MKYLNKNRTMRASISTLTVFIAVNLAGCEGGLIGTSAGPTTGTTDTYQLKSLPERISPEIPKTLLRGEELSPSQQENLDVTKEKVKISSRAYASNPGKATGWIRMNDVLATTSSTRANVEINSTIIDIAFDEILKECADQLIDCTIPADQIKVKLTQIVINRLIEIATDFVESVPPQRLNDLERADAAALVKGQFTLLLDSEVVLGETRYSQLDRAPFDHSVHTLLKRKAATEEQFTALIWMDEEFSARWHNDGSVAKFHTRSANFATSEYFYQNNNPSELVIASYVFTDDEGRRTIDDHVKVIANDPNRAGVLVEIADVSAVPVDVYGEPSTNVNHGLVQGQMDNDGGYSLFDGITINITDTRKVIGYTGLRESFDNVGKLIVRTECFVRDFNQGIEVCEEEDFVANGPIGSLITDSPYYFQPGRFDSLVAVEDVIRWTVDALPVETRRFAVVSADSAIEPSERELLCWGFQFLSDDTRIFCSATDEQLENTLVVELVDGKPGNIIPTANLVQIQ